MKTFRSKIVIMMLIDVLCIVFALVLSCFVRFEFELNSTYHNVIEYYLPYLVLLKMVIFYYCDMYRGMYRYTSISDIYNIAKGVLLATLITISSILLFNRFDGLPRSIFVLDAIFSFCLLVGNRVLIRSLYASQHTNLSLFHSQHKKNAKSLLLVGAGQAAEKIIREVHDNIGLPYKIVGLVDDDSAKIGRKIHGYPILGTVSELGDVVDDVRAEELLITIAAASSNEMQQIVRECQGTGLPYKIIPGFGELITGKSSIRSIREIAYRDLLGRPKVQLEQSKICEYLNNEVVLITGAGGSIGSELVRQVLSFKPGFLILLDACEENLYSIEMELKHECNFTDYVAVLGKVQNKELLNELFCEYSPSVVFHAAAYKHVPLVEENPWEAVFNNVVAVQNLIESSVFHKVRRFVLVSTDKAVRPTNVMGASKRLTELLMLAYCQKRWAASMGDHGGRERGGGSSAGKADDQRTKNQNHMVCMAVRFGNVLGSSGSVVPLFRKQISQGGPVTVTHPEITRYFMSIDEAAQLILQAGAMGEGGEIFLLKMGDPVKIVDLARDLIKLMGYEPDNEIKIEYTGIRPGEKLYEELITEGEGIVPTPHEKIMVLRGDGMSYAEMESNLRLLTERAKAHDARGIKEILHALIPEYRPDYGARSVVSREEEYYSTLKN